MGINIGLLFQVVDDLIDYRGDTLIAGKTTKSDQKRGKATLISLMGYKETVNFAENLKNKLEKEIKNMAVKVIVY